MSDKHKEKELMERVSTTRSLLTMEVPFFSHILNKFKIRAATPRDGVPTAAVTVDRKLLLNVEWCFQLPHAQLAFLLCHEALHPALLYFERYEEYNAMVQVTGPTGATQTMPLFNIAQDYIINAMIMEMERNKQASETFFEMIPGGCLDEDRFRGMSSEEVYAELYQEAQNNGGASMDAGWGASDCRPDLAGDESGEGEEGEGEGGDKQGGLSPEELQAAQEFWREALIEAAMKQEMSGKGELPGAVKRIVENLLNPKVDWVTVLSRWLGENGTRCDFTWRRPSRRSESIGEYLPSMAKAGVEDVTVLWDTSGSMYGREEQIMSEVITICEDLNLTLRVICCDYAIGSDNRDVQSVEDINWVGGGGSSFLPAFDLLNEEQYTGVLVVFTDGYISVPATKPPSIRSVLWVIWDGSDMDPTGGAWGETIRVTEDGYID